MQKEAGPGGRHDLVRPPPACAAMDYVRKILPGAPRPRKVGDGLTYDVGGRGAPGLVARRHFAEPLVGIEEVGHRDAAGG